MSVLVYYVELAQLARQDLWLIISFFNDDRCSTYV